MFEGDMKLVQMLLALTTGGISSAVTWLVSRRRRVIDDDTGLAAGARVLIDGSVDVVQSMQKHMERMDAALRREQERTDRLQAQVSRLTCTVTNLSSWIDDLTTPESWARYRVSKTPPPPPETNWKDHH